MKMIAKNITIVKKHITIFEKYYYITNPHDQNGKNYYKIDNNTRIPNHENRMNCY